MLTDLQQQPADALLALIKLHNADPRADKIDLGVGVYRTGQGETPVFGAIKAAEAEAGREQDSKAYLGPEGDMGFVEALMPYMFGKEPQHGRPDRRHADAGRHRIAAPRHRAWPSVRACKRLIVGKPSWPNHAQICKDLGLEVVEFNHARPMAPPTWMPCAPRWPTAAPVMRSCCTAAATTRPASIIPSAQWDEIAALVAEAKYPADHRSGLSGAGQGHGRRCLRPSRGACRRA